MTHKYTLAKTISWRIIAITITIIISYIVTKNFKIALEIGLAANIIKTVAYYIHERVWVKI